MMKDNFAIGVMVTIMMIAVFGLGYSLSKLDIRNDCLKVEAFVVNGDRFDCKIHTTP